MGFRRLIASLAFVCAAPALAAPPDALPSVVSVLPNWPGQPPEGAAPEGSGVVIGADGLIATADHVLGEAVRVEVRMSDGRVLPAAIIGRHAPSDIALLRIDEAPPVIAFGPEPGLTDRACAIGNAFGLGLSITCGVVSALGVSDAGFNAIEDFVQTDAAVNPGASGGALVDGEGRLIGLLSAIFASEGDGNLGVNFAVSAPLLRRIADDLADDGAVVLADAGWRLGTVATAETAAPRVIGLLEGGPAEQAGVALGDLVTAIDGRAVRTARDGAATLARLRPGEAVDLALLRDGDALTVTLTPGEAAAEVEEAAPADPDCPHPAAVCAARQAVFPVSAFDPAASATRIAPDLVVANRHVVADLDTAMLFTPAGPREGRVVPSAFAGDLVLLQVEGLPDDGVVLDPQAPRDTGPFFTVGADIARREIRVFSPGPLILPPADGAPLGRLHVGAEMRPGVSGGAVVDADGRLVGVAVGGGEGRYEALPVAAITALLNGRAAGDAAAVQARLGAAVRACAGAIETAAGVRGGRPDADATAATLAPCDASTNAGQMGEAARLLGLAGAFDQAITLAERAADQTPNSINARISLLVSLQLAGRIDAMVPHARWLFETAPDDPQAQRFGVQVGVWGGAPDLAEAAYARLAARDSVQARAARRFIDNPPPRPPER